MDDVMKTGLEIWEVAEYEVRRLKNKDKDILNIFRRYEESLNNNNKQAVVPFNLISWFELLCTKGIICLPNHNIFCIYYLI